MDTTMALEMTPAVALAVLNAAMPIGMFPEGAIPESDKDKVEEATKIVALAQQARHVADQIGHGNVPKWPGIKHVLSEAGIHVDTPETPPAPAAAPVSQPPASPAPVDTLVPLPAPEPAPAPPPDPRIPADAHPSYSPDPDRLLEPVAPPPVVPVAPPASPPPVASVTPQSGEQETDGPVEGERWLDASGEAWDITIYRGGPQLEARSVKTNERTTLPAGFLKSKAPEQPPPSQPAPAPEPPAETVQTTARPDDVHELAVPRGHLATITDSVYQGNTFVGNTLSNQVPLPPPDPTPPPAEPAEPSEQPLVDSAARSQAQQFVAPVDDHEGDEAYELLLDRINRNYTPIGMPVPMDLEVQPAVMPEDLTKMSDIHVRALHSQRNALASRARYLRGLEAAKARDCGRMRKKYLKNAMREARQVMGKDASVTEVTQLAEDDPDVATWIEREERHSDRAEAYDTFFRFYTEDVSVLSRDWTMRDREEKGS